MTDRNDKLPTDVEDGALNPQSAAADRHEVKLVGPAADAVDPMDEAINKDRAKADKRRASLKETGEEKPQEQWERFKAADKTQR